MSHGQRVLRVPLHAQVKGLEALQKQKGIEGRHAAAHIAQALHPGFENEGQRAEGFHVRKAVVGRVGLDEVAEAAGGLPVELAAVDDDAADRGSVAADILGGRLDHDVGSPLDGAGKNWGRGGVVDHQGHALLVGDAGQPLDVGDVELGIAQGLSVDSPGFGVDGSAQAVEVVGIDKAHL